MWFQGCALSHAPVGAIVIPTATTVTVTVTVTSGSTTTTITRENSTQGRDRS